MAAPSSKITLKRDQSVKANISRVDEIDFFKVHLKAGNLYHFSAEGVVNGKGTLADPEIEIMDANGNSLAYDDDGGTGQNSRVQYRAASTGTYYVAVDSAEPAVGTYRVSYKLDDVAGANDAGLSTEGSIKVGKTLKSQFDSSADSDFYAITLKAGRNYAFALDLLGDPEIPNGDNDISIALLDENGNLINFDTDGSLYTDNGDVAYSGKYYIAVDNFTDSSTRSYRLAVGLDGGGQLG